jgi:hypothetical protein
MLENYYTSVSTLNITYQDTYDKIIKTFPIYHNIFKKYMENGKDISWELNRIYRPIFTGLMENYEKFMEKQTILNIIYDLKTKYNPDKSFTIIDYLEYLFGNIFYETFLCEIKKINSNDIRYEHLCVFEYIINVECVKYNQYIDTIENITQTTHESKLIIAMKHRLSNCLKKISFCISWLKRNYSTLNDIIQLCESIIIQNGLESKINIESVNDIDSFLFHIKN